MARFVALNEQGDPDIAQGIFAAPQLFPTAAISEADIEDLRSQLPSPPTKDWEGFREALYGNEEYLDLLEASPIAVKLDDLIWRQQFSPLATTLWQRLKIKGQISESLEQAIAAAAVAANLVDEFALVTSPSE